MPMGIRSPYELIKCLERQKVKNCFHCPLETVCVLEGIMLFFFSGVDHAFLTSQTLRAPSKTEGLRQFEIWSTYTVKQ